MPESRGSQPGPATPPPGLAWRAVVLVLVIAGAAAWADHHLGLPLKLPAALTGFVAVGVGLVNWLLDKSVLESARASTRAFFRQRLTWTVVLVPAALLLLTVAFVSSITVQAGAPGEVAEVRVAPAQSPERPTTRRFGRDARLVRIPVLAPPWGRTFNVAADGYAAGTVRAYPVLSRRVQLEQDLQRVASVLFRPDPGALGLLPVGGVFRVWHVADDGTRELVAVDTSHHQRSYLVGPSQAIADSLHARWQRDLAPLSASHVEQIIRAWADPVSVQPSREPAAGARLVAEVVFDDTVVVSRGEARLRPVRLIDVPMVDVLSNPGGVP